jgi:hypothetical protein
MIAYFLLEKYFLCAVGSNSCVVLAVAAWRVAEDAASVVVWEVASIVEAVLKIVEALVGAVVLPVALRLAIVAGVA